MTDYHKIHINLPNACVVNKRVICFFSARSSIGKNDRVICGRREKNAKSTAQPGRGVEIARRTGRRRFLSPHQAQSEPVSGHDGGAVIHGVPFPRTVRRRSGGVQADRTVLARTRYLCTARARVRHGHNQVHVVVVPGGMHFSDHSVPSDHGQLFINAVPTIRTGTDTFTDGRLD